MGAMEVCASASLPYPVFIACRWRMITSGNPFRGGGSHQATHKAISTVVANLAHELVVLNLTTAILVVPGSSVAGGDMDYSPLTAEGLEWALRRTRGVCHSHQLSMR